MSASETSISEKSLPKQLQEASSGQAALVIPVPRISGTLPAPARDKATKGEFQTRKLECYFSNCKSIQSTFVLFESDGKGLFHWTVSCSGARSTAGSRDCKETGMRWSHMQKVASC